MIEDVVKVKEFVLLLNPTLTTLENLDSYIKLTIRKVMNDCNIKTLPDELIEITGEIVVDMISVNKDDGENEVKSISEGDTTVTFDSTSINEYKKMLNKYFKNYALQISPFRKIRW